MVHLWQLDFAITTANVKVGFLANSETLRSEIHRPTVAARSVHSTQCRWLRQGIGVVLEGAVCEEEHRRARPVGAAVIVTVRTAVVATLVAPNVVREYVEAARAAIHSS